MKTRTYHTPWLHKIWSFGVLVWSTRSSGYTNFYICAEALAKTIHIPTNAQTIRITAHSRPGKNRIKHLECPLPSAPYSNLHCNYWRFDGKTHNVTWRAHRWLRSLPLTHRWLEVQYR
jgi:hypothetical protein